MKVKTYREGSVNYTLLFMGKGSYVQSASRQQRVLQKRELPALRVARQRHWIATNHL